MHDEKEDRYVAPASRELRDILRKRGIPSEPRTVHDPAQADPEKLAQLEAVQRWLKDDWRRIEPKLRTSIVEGVSVFLSLFDDNSKVKRVFCPKKECYDPQKNANNQFGKPLPSFSWLIENGSVAALNFPIGMNAGLAKALGVMMKLDFERAVLNRVPKIEAHPELYFRQVLFLCDEYQHFATVGESDPTGDEKFFSRSLPRRASAHCDPHCLAKAGAHFSKRSAPRSFSRYRMISPRARPAICVAEKTNSKLTTPCPKAGTTRRSAGSLAKPSPTRPTLSPQRVTTRRATIASI